MSQPAAPGLLPRWAPRAAVAALLLLALGIGAVRYAGWRPASAPEAAVAERLLSFSDQPDGGVLVTDTRTGQAVQVLHGEQGFLRGVLRGLARERRASGIGAAPPYRLSLHAEGRLLITDTQTGRFIDLASFGTDNAAVFARWLPEGRKTP
jgi:putative photosynthetic complex assembly protein